VWFTDEGSTSAIGRVTVGGHIEEFTEGLKAGSEPGFIARGAGGNLWFTDVGTTKAIGQVTPSGHIEDFTEGLQAASPPGFVAPGTDGNVWSTGHEFAAGPTGAVGVIGAGAPAASIVPPSITGSGQEGTPLACGGEQWATWAGQQPAEGAVQWLRDGAPIAAAGGRATPPRAAMSATSFRAA
jgi:streptogramin lyase